MLKRHYGLSLIDHIQTSAICELLTIQNFSHSSVEYRSIYYFHRYIDSYVALLDFDH